MAGFFEEIKQRKVYRVAVAYAVVAAGLIQVASAAFPAWELPNWSLRLVIILLLIGFPISLILAWALEVSPEGIRITPSAPAAPRRRRYVIALVAVGIIVSGAAGLLLLPRAAGPKIERSIAVLPFENLSDDKENAYFADGIQDDILTNLSKIGALKVVSRTSVMGYRNKPATVREIGKALGVSTILEGTVRKSGNRVRVVVQLINAANDEHIWAQEYERDVTDVFAIQSDLAKKIANELQARLSPSEKAQLERKPTENSEAYLAFVQARDLQWSREEFEKQKQAERLYERALELDPNFALACAKYSQLESWIIHTFDPTPARRERARSLARQALQLQPDLPEGHLALGFSFYYGDGDYDAALREFEIAQKGLPNDAEVYLALGAIQRRKGHWADSNASLLKASDLNPKQTWALQNLALNYAFQRDFDNLNKTIERALRIEPASIPLLGSQAKAAIQEKGDFSLAEQLLKQIESNESIQAKWNFVWGEIANVRLLQRRWAEAATNAGKLNDETLLRDKPDALAGKYLCLGISRRFLSNEEGARAAFLKLKEFAENWLSGAPGDADARMLLAQAYAFLGEKEKALVEVKRSLEILPISKDAFHGPDLLASAAEIYVLVGEKERAFAALEELSRGPGPVTTALLKLSPAWDPVRSDPRFQQLLPKFSGKI